MKKPLTKTQYETLQWIKNFIKKKGYAPSHLELAKRFKIKLGGSTFDRFEKLIKLGYIKRDKKLKVRGITIK